ncbi:MAG: nitroreductase family protein [Rikenellaceae bacterium]
MKHIWKIFTIILTIVLFVIILTDPEPVDRSKDPIQIANIEMIMTRSSVRSYTPQIIEDEKIETILKAGMAAPTAGNRQPWEFYVVQDTSLIKEFVKVTKYAAPMHNIANTAIIVCGNPSQSFPAEPLYWVQDCSAATENILLAAHSLGLGAVWCGVYPVQEHVEILKEQLTMPEELTPLNIIMLGYPDKEPTIKDKWKPEKVHYIK